MKIAVRMDDITPDMDWERFLRMKELLDTYGICPLLGVVPKNQDNNLKCGQPRDGFYPYLRSLQEAGWVIAMHGYAHIYSSKKGGLFPLNHFSEFAGVPYDAQCKMLKEGKAFLAKQGIETAIFMAPGHSYDRNTLRALKETGFVYVTDGFGERPYRYCGLTFLPISFHRSRDFKKPAGYTTLVLHTNTISEQEFAGYEQLFEKHKTQFIDYEEYMRQPAGKRHLAGRLAEAGGANLKWLAGRLAAIRR